MQPETSLMKRIRDFKVTIGAQAAAVEHLVTGWHKAWDLAVSSLEEPTNVCHIYDAQAKHSAVIARFAAHDLQDELVATAEDKHPTRWRSETIHTANGQTRFACCNLTDFGWNWVEGAERELPFRLNYFERDAERNPRGMIARLMEVGAEARDLMRRI
jgi:hypothetical protein